MRFKIWLETEEPYLPIIDTSTISRDDQYMLGHAADVGDGELIAIHLTDSPNKVAQLLQSGVSLSKTYGENRTEELGPGLYVSAAPQLWSARSHGKWDFLKNLSPDEKQRLAQAILSHPNLNDKHYLADFERQYAQRDINRFVTDNSPHAGDLIVFLAGQPYNIPFWKPEFLQPLGIEPAKQPEEVEVRMRGRFVDLSNKMEAWPEYMQKGLDGGFVKGYHVPQFCIWQNQAITKFGEYYP